MKLNPNLTQLKEVRATDTADLYIAVVDYQLLNPSDGEVMETIVDAEYAVRPDDPYGMGPHVAQAVAEWIDAGNPVVPYVPPTPEDLRASMPPLSARQLRLGLIANGITLASVQAAVDGIADPTAREMALVEWEYATTFERTHSLISQIGSALNLTPEEIDTMWSASISL
ncbi:hypothetical protein ACLIR7_14990 [Nitratireductor aquimarinus]|uniref:hypothetical protein n=1 Tax=Nitratireductor aquimarinus TaxID=889300 RepID=UPI00398F1519